jgi:hypothetical protein
MAEAYQKQGSVGRFRELSGTLLLVRGPLKTDEKCSEMYVEA